MIIVVIIPQKIFDFEKWFRIIYWNFLYGIFKKHNRFMEIIFIWFCTD